MTFVTYHETHETRQIRQTDSSVFSQRCTQAFYRDCEGSISKPGTIHVRVKKMEQIGVIKSTSISVDYAKLGFGFVAYVGLFTSRSLQSPDIIDRLRDVPEVTVAHLATGRVWYLLQNSLPGCITCKGCHFQNK